jgi:hypothetical protein
VRTFARSRNLFKSSPLQIFHKFPDFFRHD